jgi:hypothetical protein
MTSQPVASTASALAGIRDEGSVFEVDVTFPALDASSREARSLSLSVTSPSRSLKNEPVGKVDFTGLHPGIYNTLRFPIPDKVRTALANATFKDLTFEFELSLPLTGLPPSPTAAPPQFLFDNLRVHSAPLLTAKAGVKPPAGYGGSVDLVAIGEAPATQSFAIGAVQVPDSFHLAQGTAGHTSLKLGLGHDNTAAFTCAYDADPSDTTGASYILKSCTGGVQAGDLVGANFAQLAIVGGTALMKVQAQLAKNPVGDLVGSGIIPPMPTFWGDFQGCTPAPVPGKVYTVSPGCANQMAQANKIVTDYFNKVNDARPAPNWIVTPTPEFARRHGNGLPNPNKPRLLSPQDPSQNNDFPFDQEGHLNQGGDFDAYWRLNGDLNVSSDASGNSSTDFGAEFSGHVVVFGGDVNVMSVQANTHTSSGASPSASGSANVFLFGIQLPGGGSADPSVGFNFNISQTTEINVAEVHYWIFAVEAGAFASAQLNTNGTFGPTGINLSVTPQVDMGVHIFGGVDLGIASGGVDARVDLLDVSAPLLAQAGVSVDIAPQRCGLTLNFALNGNVTISSGGGEVDLVASFGDCPFCYSDSQTIFSWPPITSTTQNLFSFGPTTLAAVPLPVSICTAPLSVAITKPGSTAVTGVSTPLAGVASSPNMGAVDCANFQWSVSPNPTQTNDTLTSSGKGCSVSANFGNLGPRTLTLNVVLNILDQFGRTITETGSASESLTVANLPPGTYITALGCDDAFTCTISVPAVPTLNGHSATALVDHFPAGIAISGEVVPSNAGATEFTATDSHGNIVPLSSCHTRICPPPLFGNPGIGVDWVVQFPDAYSLTATTKDSGGNVIGTASMLVTVQLNPR